MKPQINRTDHKSEVANYVSRMIEKSDKTQREIAIEAGYKKSVNALALIKNGHMKVAVDRVAPLCKACGEDPADLMKLVLQEYIPSVLEVMGSIKGEVITDDEKAIIGLYRSAKTRALNRYKESHRERSIVPVLSERAGISRAMSRAIQIHAA